MQSKPEGFFVIHYVCVAAMSLNPRASNPSEVRMENGELLFSVCKIASGHYLAVRESNPAFRVEGKTISEVTEKAIRVFEWKDSDPA